LKKIPQIEANVTKASAEIKALGGEDSDVKAEKSTKVKELEAEIQKVEESQQKEIKVLEKVKEKLTTVIDGPKEVEDPVSNPKPKKSTAAYEANLKKIQAEEDAREEAIEARKASLEAVPANPVVAQAEAAEKAWQEESRAKQIEELKAKEKEEEEEEARKKAAKIRAAEKDKLLKENDEIWTANMPEQYLKSFVQTQVDSMRHQLAQIEAREGDSDSDSSDSDSDDE
jgi:colicin import membrane protein